MCGFTHYWNAPKDFHQQAWKTICEDIGDILNNVQHVQGIPLANGAGDRGTQPEITVEKIFFNGVGPDDDRETFCIYAKRPAKESWESRKGNDFCKTARKPYDLAVTACLVYLSSIHGWSVSSDGNGINFLAGLELAKAVLPRYANQLDIPLAIRKDDRWNHVARYDLGFSHNKSRYDAHACWDGFVYIFDPKDESDCARLTFEEAKKLFASVTERKFKPRAGASRWGAIESTGQPLFATSGSYDERRINDLKKQQDAFLRDFLNGAKLAGLNIQPPAFARPKIIAKPDDALADNLADFLDLCGV